MKVVLQRVTYASVTDRANGYTQEIGLGLAVLLGVGYNDTQEDIDYLCKKIAALRIFDDQDGVMNRSVADVGGEILLVSQFTLMARTAKGNRPSYIDAARAEVSEPLYQAFKDTLQRLLPHKPIRTGVFGADMLVQIHNSGPVTIIMDSQNRF